MLITFLVFVLIVVALFYVTGLIPDATLQKVARVIIVVGALIWLIQLIQHLRPLLASVGG